MLKVKEQIANFFTLLNLASGVLAIMFILNENVYTACLFVFVGAFFDFIDGFVARALGIASEMGKQLDSLSDVVTFGVVPGLIAYSLILIRLPDNVHREYFSFSYCFSMPHALALIALLIPAFSALRLAKFNIDTRQSKNFIGLPTPANGILWASFGLIVFGGRQLSVIGMAVPEIDEAIRFVLKETWVLVLLVIMMSFILVSPLQLMGLKFDKFTWKGNELKFLLAILGVVLFLTLGFPAIPIILLLYIIFSIIHFYVLKKT